MQAFFKELAAIVGQDNLFTDHAARVACARGASFAPRDSGHEELPLACVRPGQAAQVGKILSLCSRLGQPVSFRGGATAPVASPAPALVILTTGLNRIYEVNAAEQTICLQPGVICQTAREAAARDRLYLPGLPLSAAVATIGGALANNAVGPDTARYGFLASHVLSLDIWLASGEKITCFGANDLPGQLVPGLPLAQLLAGSRGSLGFLGDARLRLMPGPASRARLLVGGSLERVTAAAMRLNALQPADLYLLDGVAVEAVFGGVAQGEDGALLFVELHEPGQEEMAREIALEQQLTLQGDSQSFLQARPGIPAALYGGKGPFLREICAFPASRLDKFVSGALDIAARRQVRLAIYGNAASARMEAAIFPGATPEAATAAAQELFALELMLNEALESEADALLTRAEWQKRHRAGIAALSRQLRKLFDPAGILNGGLL